MRALLLFIPYWVSLFFDDQPEVQYWICWGGSFWIFLLTFAGWVNPLPKDRSFFGQFMRPFIFAHLLCAGYMALSSIFFFLNAKGYFYLDKIDAPNLAMIVKVARCQQFYQLAHAAFATGLTGWMQGFGQTRYEASPITLDSKTFLRITLFVFVLAQGISFLPFGSAFRSNLDHLSLLASLLFLVQALSEKKQLLFALILFGINVSQGILSGMKSATLMIILFLGAHYFSRYRWQTIASGVLALWLWFSFIPTISVFIREQSWHGGQSATAAVQNAFSSIQNQTIDTRKLNWEMLVFRSSEAGMFVRYVDHVPARRDFYGFRIAEQALMGLLPRFIRPDGKTIDQTAMERVYEVGIIDPNMDRGTSAKPALIADAYMSAAELGILITFFLFGYMATQLAKTCEALFGGYLLGSVLVFNGCFSIFQSGNCFENIPASIFYGVVTMYFMYYLLMELKIIVKTSSMYFSKN